MTPTGQNEDETTFMTAPFHFEHDPHSPKRLVEFNGVRYVPEAELRKAVLGVVDDLLDYKAPGVKRNGTVYNDLSERLTELRHQWEKGESHE